PTLCLTPTCAANFLDLVPAGDCARGNPEPLKEAFQALAETLKKPASELAEAMLQLACRKVHPVVSSLMRGYKLDADTVKLGGGGAAAIVPFLSRAMHMRHALAENADVISAIGVSLALVRETIERQIVQPDSDDILRVRQEAQAAVQLMGADPASIEVHVEVDARTNTVRATATGATSLETVTRHPPQLSAEEIVGLVADSMRVPVTQLRTVAGTDHFVVYGADTVETRLKGLIKIKRHSLRTV